MRIRLLPLLVLALLFAGNAAAEIYKWRDDDGRLHFSDAPPEDRPAEKVEPSTVPAGTTIERTANRGPVALPPLQRGEVLMYVGRGCDACRGARDYFARHGIAAEERNIDDEVAARREFDRLGGRDVPLILLGTRAGTQQMRGFSASGFERMYSTR